MAKPRAKIVLPSPANPPPPAASTPPKLKAERRADRVDSKFIGGHYPKATWKRLRDLSTRTEKKQQELMDEALTLLFAHYGEP